MTIKELKEKINDLPDDCELLTSDYTGGSHELMEINVCKFVTNNEIKTLDKYCDVTDDDIKYYLKNKTYLYMNG